MRDVIHGLVSLSLVLWTGIAHAETLARPPGEATSSPIESIIRPVIGEPVPELKRPSDTDQINLQLRPAPPGTELPIQPVRPGQLPADPPLKPAGQTQ